MESVSVPSLILLPSTSDFFSSWNYSSKPIHQGFPSSNTCVKPSWRAGGVVSLVVHIKDAFLWTDCLERLGSLDSAESCTFIQKGGGGGRKGKKRSHRGLPVWGNSPWAKPVFLSNFLRPFQNKQGSQIKQSCWVNTRPLNGYTLPELNFSFVATSKVRKITFFVSVVNIIPVTFGDCWCFISANRYATHMLSSWNQEAAFSEWIPQWGT